MAKAILTSKPDSGYEDIRERRYHFPKTYLHQIEQAVGDFFIYYEPRRSSTELSSLGGRQSYIAIGRITHITPDNGRPNHYFAHVDNYLDFDRAVPFEEEGDYYEATLKKADGSTNKGAFGRSVRLISDQEFENILTSGFRAGADPLAIDSPFELGEEQLPFQRRILDQIISRPWRDRKFSRHIQTLYDATCAVTGLQIINGGGRPEIEAAHIQPVGNQHGGDDSVRNGIALCRTAHWMFDRGLISLSDDYEILIAKNLVPDQALAMLRADRRALVPPDPSSRPAIPYLSYHRDVIYKGT